MIDFPKQFKDPEDQEYILKRETWAHIVSGHGEVANHLDEIRKCIETPDEIIQSDQSHHRYIYRRNPDKLDYNFFVVVVDRNSGSVVTVYATNRNKF